MATVKSTSVQSLMTKAQQSLSRNHWFEAERLCARALDMARGECDFNLMARIVLPLLEARRQRMQVALDSKKLVIIDEPSTEERQLEPKCYLVQSPLVGADARRLRLLALEREIPVMVLCREPKTQLGLCPIVGIGQVTVRTRIDPPKKWEKPDFSWYAQACETLGDAAIEALDRTAEPARQVDALLERLDTVPDHEKLHQALADACKAAARHYTNGQAPQRATVKIRTGEQAASTADIEEDE